MSIGSFTFTFVYTIKLCDIKRKLYLKLFVIIFKKLGNDCK